LSLLYSVFGKVFVKEFYRQHALFFIVAVAILGGFMSGREHIALASFFVSTPSASLFPLIAWVAYLLKAMGFFRQSIQQKENEFIYHFILFSRVTQLKLIVSVWFSLLLPVLAYGFFLLFMAFKFQQGITIALLLPCLALLILTGSLFSLRLLNNPSPERTPGFLKQWMDKKFYKSYGMVLTEFILRNHGATFLMIKTGAVFLLYCVLFLYTTEAYDLRLLAMAATVAFAGTSPFIYAIQQFENTVIPWIRNMPITLLKRMGYRLFCIGLLWLPEIAMLAGRFPTNLLATDFILMILLLLSQVVLYHGTSFMVAMHPERFNRIVFFITIIEVVLVLFNIPILILMLTNSVLGAFLYRYFYYR
jgi:hypothetical protein